MDFSQFETLAQKVEHAVGLIDELKREREHLQSELHTALEKAGHFERLVVERDEEIARMRGDLEAKSENINMAGERIRTMMSRLESALA
jgi:predicted  nucleic acid-binding Zn-ribbon protein